MSRLAALSQLILQHRYRLGFTYFLFLIETAGNLLRPLFLGMAVNDLIKGSYAGLIWLCVVHMIWLVIGTIRHRLDTRTYSAIYTSMVTRFLARRYQQGEVSKLSAHSTLARELVDFLEFDMVYVMEAVYNIFGSLILISYSYGRRMRKLNRMKNDELEKQVDVISSGNGHMIRQHYDNLRKWQVRISDQEAWNFGIMELLVMIVIGLSVLITNKTMGAEMEAGSLIGIYSYIQRFVSGMDTIPYTVQRLSSLKDILFRMRLQEEDLQTPPLREVA